VREEREKGQAKGNIEPGNRQSRVEFLARMCETRKANQGEEKAAEEDTETTEE